MFNPHAYVENNPFFEVQDEHRSERAALESEAKKQIEIERLCYEIFHVSDNGKRLMELYREEFIDRSFFYFRERFPKYRTLFDSHPQMMGFYWEAYRDALRGMSISGLNHKKRCAGVNG